MVIKPDHDKDKPLICQDFHLGFNNTNLFALINFLAYQMMPNSFPARITEIEKLVNKHHKLYDFKLKINQTEIVSLKISE